MEPLIQRNTSIKVLINFFCNFNFGQNFELL